MKARIPAQDYLMPKPIILITMMFWISSLYPIFSPLLLDPHPIGGNQGKDANFLYFSKVRFLKNEDLDQ